MKTTTATLMLFLFFYPGMSQIILRQNDYDSIMYLYCGHDLKINMPEITGELSYSPKGGMVIPSENDRRLLIFVPTARKASLEITEDGNFVTSYVFHVRRIPPPTLELQYHGKRFSSNSTIQIPLKGKLDFVIKPDSHFKNTVPDEARYEILELKASAHKNGEVFVEKKFKGSSIGPSDLTVINPGDTLTITCDKFIRYDFRDLTGEVPLSLKADFIIE